VEIPIALASGDLVSVRRNAHAIVGHAHLVEADALASCARELEDAAGGGDDVRLRALVGRLKEEAGRVAAILTKNCADIGKGRGEPGTQDP
jgi:HPt (histidine-containing phosphotransfer) domain-containing protein